MEYDFVTSTRKLIHTAHEMIYFDLAHLAEFINWVDDDFYALTNGDPIGISGNLIQRDKNKPPVNEYTVLPYATVVVRDPVNGNLLVLSEGDWLVKHPVLGYQVYDNETIQKLYLFDTDESENVGVGPDAG